MGLRRSLSVLLGLLLGVLLLATGIAAPPAAAEGVSTPAGERELILQPDSVVVAGELAYPTVLRYPGADPTVLDLLSGRVVQPRSLEDAEPGTWIRVPQLPVGSYRVDGSAGSMSFRIDPESGEPVEISGLDSRTGSGFPWWVPLLALPGIALLRRRRAALLLALPVLLLAGALSLTRPDPSRSLTWQECDLLGASGGREQELLRRDCKVRYLLTTLGPDASGNREVATFMTTVTDQGCHEVAHLAGYYFSRINPDVDVARRAMLLGCNDGFAHGVLEALAVFTSDTGFVETTNEICESFEDQAYRRTCAHGVGHAMLWRTGGDLMETWDLCGTIRDERSDDMDVLFNRFKLTDTRYSSRAECKSASIMEWSDRWRFEQFAGTSTVLSPVLEEPMDICIPGPGSVDLDEEMFQVGCYLGTNFRTRNPEKAAARCNEVAPYPVSCFAALGDNLAQFAPYGIGEREYFELARTIGQACTTAIEEAASFACARHLSYRFRVSVRSGSESAKLCSVLPARLGPGCVDGQRFAEDVLAGYREFSGGSSTQSGGDPAS